jgi:hypothetical protein
MTGTEFGLWATGIVGLITATMGAIVLFYKTRIASRVSKNAENIEAAKAKVADTIELAEAQFRLLVVPLQDELDGYRHRIEALETERQKEKLFLEEYRRIVGLFADHLTHVHKWIDENITDRKTKIPELPEELNKYKNGVR